ncbi:MAG: NADH-quinone oxidoreductase subunit H, partial [Acidimicrobiia bacterium]
ALPRLRYDQLMNLGWRYMVPIGLIWLGIAAVFRVAQDRDWDFWIYLVAPAGGLLIWSFLKACWPTPETEEAPA